MIKHLISVWWTFFFFHGASHYRMLAFIFRQFQHRSSFSQIRWQFQVFVLVYDCLLLLLMAFWLWCLSFFHFYLWTGLRFLTIFCHAFQVRIEVQRRMRLLMYRQRSIVWHMLHPKMPTNPWKCIKLFMLTISNLFFSHFTTTTTINRKYWFTDKLEWQ